MTSNQKAAAVIVLLLLWWKRPSSNVTIDYGGGAIDTSRVWLGVGYYTLSDGSMKYLDAEYQLLALLRDGYRVTGFTAVSLTSGGGDTVEDSDWWRFNRFYPPE